MKKIVDSFKNKKVLLIGDIFLDVYIYGKTVGKGLGTSVPRVEEERTEISLGGNGLVAKNILELGGSLYFVSVVGDDENAKLIYAFKHPKLRTYFLVDKTKRTGVKRRIFADKKRILHLNSVDHFDIAPIIEKKIISTVRSLMPKIDCVVIMDPQHGLFTKSLVKEILELSRKYKKPLLVDTQVSHRPSNYRMYRGSDTMFLNESEARAVFPKFDIKNSEHSVRMIQKEIEVNNVVVKLGERGSVALFGKEFIKSKPFEVRAVDAVGAGDAFLAAFSLGDRNLPKESLEIANIWGALSTEIHGTVPPKKKNLQKAIR